MTSFEECEHLCKAQHDVQLDEAADALRQNNKLLVFSAESLIRLTIYPNSYPFFSVSLIQSSLVNWCAEKNSHDQKGRDAEWGQHFEQKRLKYQRR